MTKLTLPFTFLAIFVSYSLAITAPSGYSPILNRPPIPPTAVLDEKPFLDIYSGIIQNNSNQARLNNAILVRAKAALVLDMKKGEVIYQRNATSPFPIASITKLMTVVTFMDLEPDLKKHIEDVKGDDCFFCIGTTKKNSPDKNEYKRIERDIPVEIAKIAKTNLVNSFLYVSSGFANPKNSGAYLRYKGEVENELKKLNFSKLGIMRPSFLMGNRKEKRFGEKIGIFLFKLLSPLFLGPLKKMKPIQAENVAKSMIKVSNGDFQKTIFESNEIVEFANN